MSLIGYARVSTADQSLDVQLDQLRDAGCDRIFQEKVSGRTNVARPAWDECLEFLREGDILVFTRLDRIGRSQWDLVNIGRILRERQVEIRCIQQQIDTTTPVGRALWGFLAVMAEFEMDLRNDRQKEGIARAKAAKKYAGGKRKITAAMVGNLKAQGLGAADIARELRCDRRTIYRAHPEGWGENPVKGRT